MLEFECIYTKIILQSVARCYIAGKKMKEKKISNLFLFFIDFVIVTSISLVFLVIIAIVILHFFVALNIVSLIQ